MSTPQRMPPVIKKAIGTIPTLLAVGSKVGANDFYKPNLSFWNNPARSTGDITLSLFATTAKLQVGTPPSSGPNIGDVVVTLDAESYLIVPEIDFFDKIVIPQQAKFFCNYETFDPDERIYAIASGVGLQVRITGGKDSLNG